jgi:hypothetical protein
MANAAAAMTGTVPMPTWSLEHGLIPVLAPHAEPAPDGKVGFMPPVYQELHYMYKYKEAYEKLRERFDDFVEQSARKAADEKQKADQLLAQETQRAEKYKNGFTQAKFQYTSLLQQTEAARLEHERVRTNIAVLTESLQAASSLKRQIVDLQKQIEELKAVNVQSLTALRTTLAGPGSAKMSHT